MNLFRKRVPNLSTKIKSNLIHKYAHTFFLECILSTLLDQTRFHGIIQNTYTLFDGLAYNTCRYFASCIVFVRAPQGQGKILAMCQMSARIIGLLFHYKKILFCNWLQSIFLGKSIHKNPDLVCKNDVNNELNESKE